MRSARRYLSCVVKTWLICQLSVLALTPVAICMGAPVASTGVTCTCAHGDDQACPMHHPGAAPKPCSCRSTGDAGSAIAAALLGSAAVLPHAVENVPLASFSDISQSAVSVQSDRSRVPDAPPPRA